MTRDYVTVSVRTTDADFWTVDFFTMGDRSGADVAVEALEEALLPIVQSEAPIAPGDGHVLADFACSASPEGEDGTRFEVIIGTKGGPSIVAIKRVIAVVTEGSRVLTSCGFVLNRVVVDAD